jgi:AraC family transcriptional regulator, regulatory protein of adaptative response / DNA-3-methyladenine glycosylase II
MQLDHETCYRALLSHDPRFDGAFFVGVSSTMIYCRTVCPAKPPKPENCTFYPSAAAAEKAGYRPCLRCRPELAPGNARIDALGVLAAGVAGRIEDGALSDLSMDELAAEFGVTARHLRRVVEAEFGVTPIALAQTKRLLTAKHLLTDTRMTITDVAFASGFSSLRRFNALFQERYRMTPTDLRRKREPEPNAETISCRITYRPPLDWQLLLGFLSARSAAGVEAISNGQYLRTVCIGKHRGWISVTSLRGANALQVQLSASLAPAFLPIVARVKRLFDLAANPSGIAEHLGYIALANPGIRVPGAFDGFEVAVRAILGQQVSVKAATTLACRFAALLGEPIETPCLALTHLTPTPDRVAQAGVDEVASIGLVRNRAASIIALATEVAAGRILLEPGTAVENTMERLRRLPGIGEWTEQYIAMRCLGWPDAFPHSDLGLAKALGESDPRTVLRVAEQWRPWRAYAVMHLWNMLTGEPK